LYETHGPNTQVPTFSTYPIYATGEGIFWKVPISVSKAKDILFMETII